MLQYRYDFEIAGLWICLRSKFLLEPSANFCVFQKEGSAPPDYIIDIITEPLKRQPEQEEILYTGARYQISIDAHYKYRTFFHPFSHPIWSFTLVQELKNDKIRKLYIPKEAVGKFSTAKNWTFFMAFEEMLFAHHMLLLHASYIDTARGAVLFSGASGAGKSTQADLWEKSGYGTVINGDRTVIGVQDGKLFAAGSPCAGTSGICIAHDSPIAAIVILSQGKENKLQRLVGKDALIPLMRESMFPYMDSAMKQTQMDLLLAVAEHCSVYKFDCTKDEHAVDVLRIVLGVEEKIYR